MSVGILPSVEFSYVVLYLSLTKLCSAASFTRAPHYFTPSLTYVEEQQPFPNTAKTI